MNKIIENPVISREITPLSSIQKMCFIGLKYRALLSISTLSSRRGGMLMPTSFAPISILKNIYEGGGYNAAKGLISRDIAKTLCSYFFMEDYDIDN